MNPTVTNEQIEALMEGAEIETATIFEKVTLVSVKLANGFVLTASSGAVSKENYSEEIGRGVCLSRIRDELWKLEGYALQKRLAESTDH